MLLTVTIQVRKARPPEELPVYFLNPDVVSEMEAKLVKVQQILQKGSFQDIDEYLRPKKAEFFLVTEGKYDVGSPTPGPCIFILDGQIEIAYYEKTVPVTPGRSLEYALIQCLVIYFILNLSYPHAFVQTLGIFQTVLLQNEGFDRCLMSFKLKALIKQLMPMLKKWKV